VDSNSLVVRTGNLDSETTVEFGMLLSKVFSFYLKMLLEVTFSSDKTF